MDDTPVAATDLPGDDAIGPARAPVVVNVSLAGCRPFPALCLGRQVLALSCWRGSAGLHGTESIEALLRAWATNGPALQALCEDPATARLLQRRGSHAALFRLHAPVAPRQIHCTIGNYRCQWLEAAVDSDDGPHGPGADGRRAAAASAIERRVREGEPYICLKSVSALAGPGEPLLVDEEHDRLDWEVEIGVVIGRPAWRVPADAALEFVAGYCVVNDITRRDRVVRTDPGWLGSDWLQSKGGPGWLPAGPWLVPAWQVADPSALRLRLRLNGALMQDGVAADMVFGIREQIAYLSRHTRLEPGDLLCTGSPAGFGSHHGRYLRDGDLVEASVEGLGVQRTRCVARHRKLPLEAVS